MYNYKLIQKQWDTGDNRVMVFEAFAHLREALLILVLVSLPSVAWFFRMRRIMLARQVSIIRRLEEALKPRDKRYWLLGYLVGFTAKYWIYKGAIGRVGVTYTTPPYHAFFYLPVIIIGGKREKIEVEVESRYRLRNLGVAHIYSPRMHSVKMPVEREAREDRRLTYRGSKDIDGRRYRVYYQRSEALEEAKTLLHRLGEFSEVHRVSIDTDRRIVKASVTLKSIEDVGRLVDLLLSEVEDLSTGERG